MSKRPCKKCKKNPKRKCCRKGDHISHGSSKVSVRVIVPQQASAPAQLPDFGVYQEQNRMSFAEIHQLIKKIEPTSISNAIKSPIGKVEQQTQTNIPNIFIDKGKGKAVSPPGAAEGLGASPRSPPAENEAPGGLGSLAPVPNSSWVTPELRQRIRAASVEPESSNVQQFYHPINRIVIKHGGNAYNDLLDEGHRLQQASPERSKLGMPLEDYRAHFRQYHTQREYPATQPF